MRYKKEDFYTGCRAMVADECRINREWRGVTGTVVCTDSSYTCRFTPDNDPYGEDGEKTYNVGYSSLIPIAEKFEDNEEISLFISEF